MTNGNTNAVGTLDVNGRKIIERLHNGRYCVLMDLPTTVKYYGGKQYGWMTHTTVKPRRVYFEADGTEVLATALFKLAA